MTRELERRIQLFGWVLFIISAIGFIASSAKSRDVFGIVGGIFFLVACFVFLIPLIWHDTAE
jgi:F0F1-type ATP synthase assembly protein I